MVLFAVFLSVVTVAALLAPFWLGAGDPLDYSASLNSAEQLEKLKDEVLSVYLKDERAFASGLLSGKSWRGRRDFLVNRYIDAARRLDFVARRQSGA